MQYKVPNVFVIQRMQCVSVGWRVLTMWAGSLVPRWTPFWHRAVSRLTPAQEETRLLSISCGCWRGGGDIVRRAWRQRHLWSGRSSASAPTGPAAGSCSADTRRSGGSGTTTAMGRPARSVRGDRTRPRSPPARGRPPESGRLASWTGSPVANRK